MIQHSFQFVDKNNTINRFFRTQGRQGSRGTGRQETMQNTLSGVARDQAPEVPGLLLLRQTEPAGLQPKRGDRTTCLRFISCSSKGAYGTCCLEVCPKNPLGDTAATAP